VKHTLGGFETSQLARYYVNDVLDTGRLSYGPYSVAFENKFATLHGCQYGVLSNSGTSSLVVALQAAKEYYGWNDGDEVIVPALTFVATVNAILHNNLTPILVDIEADYYNIDVTQIEAAISPYTRAIIPVHLFGQPANMPVIMGIAQRHELIVIEDSCETILAEIEGKVVGSWGDMACFSTYVAHHLVMGVGGITTTNNPILERLLRSLVNHGIDLDQLPNGADYDPTYLARRFSFTRVGHSFRITELEAAIGCAQLKHILDTVKVRQRNAHCLTKQLSRLTPLIQTPAIRPNATHTFMVYPLVMAYDDKAGIMAWLVENDIEVRDMVPLTNQPCYRGLFDENDYPVAKNINHRGFYVGCHQGLCDADMIGLGEIIQRYFGG
jgi:perosamine synthetase